ncbi:EAL domain-containing response regulator [Zestomonas thermotolerans]|uniref:EAL domain-containing response regulator n=1 Tax=Zestomonas thermotolerans TaxID=157784 RepID=UPI0004B27968|nr:EAL domain-containing response regulator [Pseudomonas thermotolerans]
MQASTLFPLPELPESIRSRRILIVEDSAFQRELLCELLRGLGFSQLQAVAEGGAALELLRGYGDDLPLLLLDLEMPGMNGIELLQQLGEEQILPLVLIVTAREEALVSAVEGMMHAAGLPLLGSLGKPISGASLHALLAKADRQPACRWQQPVAQRFVPDEEALVRAIQQGGIQPYYQPKVHLKSGQVTGYEVLARWIEADGTQISPADFIPMATGCGVLGELTFCLVDQVLRDLCQLGDDRISMAFNIDISLLANRYFADELIHRVALAGYRPDQFVLEITESALMDDPVITLASVGRLRLAGFGLSIDDYGTGFSTLRQLSRLPFTELKIDRAFVRDADSHRRARAILHSAIEMGRHLGLPCVAEGVENKAELLLLDTLGCHSVQGFLLARPMPAGQLFAWHAEHRGCHELSAWYGE